MENDRTLAASVVPVDDTLASDAGAGSVRGSSEPSDYDDLVTVETSHYAIERELARGGMGRIFSARDRRLGRRVAIKELLVNDAGLEVRFEREARITARLQHPAVVNVHEAGRWKSGAPFFVMQLVTGKPLDQVIAKTTSLPERLALLPNVIAAVDALAYAHSERVIHRDLKPSNVLVGDYGETVVIDWGLAKDLLSTSEIEPAGPYRTPVASGGETVVGSILGTPAYMPPEQATGAKVDERADVYALGAMLYHVLAGVPPYIGRNADELLDKVIAGGLTPLAKRVPEVPADLAAIVDKAMSRDAADRFASANELATELKKFQTGQLVSVHRYSATEIFGRWVRKHRAAVATGAVLATALAATAAVSVRKIVHARDVADDERAHTLEEQGRQELVAHRPNRALAYLEEASTIGLAEPSLDLLLDHARAATSDIAHVSTAHAAITNLSPDAAGDVIVGTASEDVRAFTATGAPVSLPATTTGDYSLASDGSQLAAVEHDHIKVYDFHTGALKSELVDAGDVLAVSRDRLATIRKHTIALWDTTSSPPRQIVEQDGVSLGHFETWHGREALVVIAGDGRKMRAIDAAAGTEIQTLDIIAPDQPSTSMVQLSSGWLLVPTAGDESDSDQRRIYAIHGIDAAASGKTIDVELRSKSLHGETIAPHGEVVAGWDDEGLVLVDPARHRTITRIDLPKPDLVEPLEVDGRAAFAVLADGVVSIYDGFTGLRTHVLDGHAGKVTTMAGTGDGIHLVTGGDDGRIVTWAPHTRLATATRNHAHAISPSGHRMAVIDSGHASITGDDRIDFDVRNARAIDVAWSANRAAIVDDAGTVSIASFAGKTTARLDAHTQHVVFDPSGERLATLDPHGAKLWRVDGTPIVTLAGQRDIVSFAQWTPDGQLVTAGDDGQLVRWSSDGVKHVVEDSGGSIEAFAVSPRWIAVGSGDGWVRAYDQAGTSHQFVGHGETATAIAISPDESMLASGGRDGRIRLWSLPEGKPLAVLEHGEPVRGLAFRGDSAILASGGDVAGRIGSVKLWNARGGVLLDAIEQPGDVRFTDDGAIAIRGVMGSAVWRTTAGPVDTGAPVWRIAEGRLVQRNTTPLLPAPSKTMELDLAGAVVDFSDQTLPQLSVPSPTTPDEHALQAIADQLSHGHFGEAADAATKLDGTTLTRADALVVLAEARHAAGHDDDALRWARAAFTKHASVDAALAIARFAPYTTEPVAAIVGLLAGTPKALVELAGRYVESGRVEDAGAVLDAAIAGHHDVVDAQLAKATIAATYDRTNELVAALDAAATASSTAQERDRTVKTLDRHLRAMHDTFVQLRILRYGDAARSLTDIRARLGLPVTPEQHDRDSIIDAELAGRGAPYSTLRPSLKAAIAGHNDEVVGCFDRAVARDRSLKGDMHLKVTIDTMGDVAAVTATGMTDRQLQRCLEDRVARWHFGPGRRSVVNFPLRFFPTTAK